MAVPYNLPRPNSEVTIEQFLGTLFQYRDKIHLAHLHTTSYASHVATEELYENILSEIDKLAETQQSKHLLSITIPLSVSDENAENIVLQLINYIAVNRVLFIDSFSQQLIDNIVEMLNRTLYKIRHLK